MITPTNTIPQAAGAIPQAAGQQGGGSGPAFADLLRGSLEKVAETGTRAEAQVGEAAAGRRPELVDVVTAVAESEAALETLVAVRDKVVQAYEEIMRMPI